MKVQQLIDMLEEFDGDEEVVFAYGYGDYWRNTVAAEPRCVERDTCEYSAYHQMLKLVDVEDGYHDDPEDLEDVKECVVIR